MGEYPELRGAGVFTDCEGGLLWAGAHGLIYFWDMERQAVSVRGKVGLSPVTALASLPDGRIYCFAGSGISHWFRLDPGSENAVDLGVATSVLTERRYGFEFCAIVRGKGGELYCAENDRGGHLWLYFQ